MLGVAIVFEVFMISVHCDGVRATHEELLPVGKAMDVVVLFSFQKGLRVEHDSFVLSPGAVLCQDCPHGKC